MKENVWLTYDEKSREELHTLSEEYKTFLSRCKTERECTAFFQAEAEKAGYRNLSSLIAEGAAVKSGDKVYAVGVGKTKKGAEQVAAYQTILLLKKQQM